MELNRRNFLKALCAGTASGVMPRMLCAAQVPANTAESKPAVIKRKAKDTLTAFELNKGDTLLFELLNGQTCRLTLRDTSARILLKGKEATLYHFTCLVAIDGHEMLMERYVGTQETYYEP